MFYNQRSQIETVSELCNLLSDYDGQYCYVHQLVEQLVSMGLTPKVYAMHDDFLGMPGDLSEAFKYSLVEYADSPIFEEDAACLLGEANIIIPLFSRQLTGYDYEMIAEDRRQIGY